MNVKLNVFECFKSPTCKCKQEFAYLKLLLKKKHISMQV